MLCTGTCTTCLTVAVTRHFQFRHQRGDAAVRSAADALSPLLGADRRAGVYHHASRGRGLWPTGDAAAAAHTERVRQPRAESARALALESRSHGTRVMMYILAA